jgi:Ser/Thr protein kinase RdoA (MazF antagonist)
VKLHYEDWFGEDCFQTEREAYRMLADQVVPVPELLAEGALYDEGWRWPFLVMTAMGGHSLRELEGELTPQDRARVASWLGTAVRALHGVPIRDGERISHEVYSDLIQIRLQRSNRDHEQWASLPSRLVPLVRDYLWEARTLIDPERATPVFLHGDLHAGNVFVGDVVAIHTKVFDGDKELLRTFLDAYGWGELGRRWPRRMMALTLAHDFDMVKPITERIPEDVESLDDLATLLWDLDEPGLPTRLTAVA